MVWEGKENWGGFVTKNVSGSIWLRIIVSKVSGQIEIELGQKLPNY
jgi:hypothetical protein